MEPIILPSGSEITRVIACPPSALEAKVTAEDNEYSTAGTTFHSFAEDIGNGISREDALTKISPNDPGVAICESFPVDQIPKGGMIEAALAYHCEKKTARVLGQSIGRDYGAAGADRSVEYVMTADWLGKDGDCAIVIDYKTGFLTGRLVDSWQMKIGALAWSKVLGLSRARIAFCIPREDQSPIWRVEEIDELELLYIENRMSELREKLLVMNGSDEPRSFTEGDHCRYCPAQNRCPAKISAIQAFAAGSENTALQLVTQDGQEITPVIIATVARRIMEYDAARAVVWKQIEKYAKVTPLDLGDGRVLKMAPARASDKIQNPQAALDFLATHFGVDTARAATSTSKTAIEEAAASHARATKQPIGKAKEEVIELLRQVGIIAKVAGKMDVRIVEEN